ncbi:MAG: ABC transporter substrate-binding protein [Candidatus Promineifilaceae bacterium]|nr:ABC transporter substrate-binding protein [Candidatus Promineifilaceae bacterium]
MNLAGTNFRLHNKRLLPFITVLMVLALALSACGGEEEVGDPEPVEEVVDDEVEEDVDLEIDEEAADEPVDEAVDADEDVADDVDLAGRDGVLRVAMQPLVQTDPGFISSDSEVLIASHVYDYLVDIDAQSNPIPRLATDWTISDDGLVYTFNLASDVTWHDGDPFTAEDVVWTFNRLRDPVSDLPTVDLYRNIDTVEATDDLEVTFTLSEPNPFFLFDLSDNHALITKAGVEDVTGFNGTGPFVVSEYIPEDRIELVANPDYFIEGQPALEGLEIVFFNDETAAVDALQGGQIDLVMRMSTPLFESLQGQPGIETLDIPTNGFDLVRLRADRAPGDDPRVIEALKLATDREAIFGLVQQGYGAIGNDTPIGPLYERYHAETIEPPARDVARARELLADAGYEDGLELVLHVPDTGNRPDLATVLQAQWAEAGVDVEISVEPESVYYGDNGWLEVDLGITGWGSRPYPQFYLDTMLACGAQWNEAHYCNERLDELIEVAGTTQDEEERAEAYREIQQLLVDEGPIIIPYYFAQFAAINDQFEDFELKAFAGRSDLRDVRLAE